MKKLYVFNLIIISILLFFSCSNEKNTITDIIPNINLEFKTEKIIVISDLFYSENYKLVFLQNPFVDVKQTKDSSSIILQSKNDFVGMTLIDFTLDDNVYSIPVTIHKNASYKFQFKPDRKYSELYLFGSFNGWNRKDIAMTDENGDGTFEAEVTLEPGVYAYKFFGDGEEIVDPVNPNKTPNGFGSFNSLRTIEEAKTEKIFLHVGNNKNKIFSFVIEGIDFSKNITQKNIITLLNNNQINEGSIAIEKNKIIVDLADYEFGERDLLRLAVTKEGRTTNFQNVFLANGNPISNSSKFDWHDGIIYSLMIDRFSDGDTSINNPVIHDSLSSKANYMGGDLQGVINKLNDSYFDSLGINTIWISPVY
ncbi:MAG: hypothetical protein COW71_03225, partial [Ignavibacteriales bacterium CG18_big_fil_WC_8_21_14_2_50_31_20]